MNGILTEIETFATAFGAAVVLILLITGFRIGLSWLRKLDDRGGSPYVSSSRGPDDEDAPF